MRNSNIIILSLFTVFLLVACGVSRDSSSKPADRDPNVVMPKTEEGDPTSWEILFRKVPGVQVAGNYPNLSLRIRGAQSMNLTTEPLFVLEGVPLGHDFASLARAVMPMQVKSIRVLKGSDATIYGARGANGVVEVILKK
ncbi:MAG: TonB-dependent receptor plug domain-containing protein [Saprospiraceae bacterium]|nr:TonB-dependent receptor plug domain-containing protein [Saprospiraceae bacterium]